MSEPHPLRFFNTRTRRIEPFAPIAPPKVTLYCCGPTVYNYAHIGNLRTYVFEDLLQRTIRLAGYDLHHVMNITDVGHLESDADQGDDKMMLAAARERKSPWDIARFYEDEFFRHTDMMKILRPDTICRATGHIPQMIAMIERLVARGHAYAVDGNVYFDTATFPAYPDFARLQMDAQEATERIDADERKRNPADFVLWFGQSKYPNQIMKWESPWGVGFPGWHIECSAMATEYLGETIDMHCGGIDHVPVHHTNEIAQSEGCFGHRWVNTWLHGEFLVVDDAKMAKSSGDFLHLDRLVEAGYDPMDYRYLLLTGHYRARLSFSFEALDGARQSLRTLRNLAHDWSYAARERGVDPDNPAPGSLRHYLQELLSKQTDKNIVPMSIWWMNFWNALSNDLHIPNALAVAWKMARDTKLTPTEKLTLMLEFDTIFGLDLAASTQSQSLPDDLMDLIARRETARADKDWATADALRDELRARGVAIKDRPGGTDWELAG